MSSLPSTPENPRKTFEVELKFKVVDVQKFRSAILSRDCRFLGSEDQEDLYLAHPGRDFARTGEAFRVRRIGSLNRVTYKGPKQPGPTKTREEIEIGFESGSDAFDGLRSILLALGFEPVATVCKERDSFEVLDAGRVLVVVIDEVVGLGTFAEIETMVEGQADLEDGQRAVQRMALELGLDAGHAESRSYLRMLLESRNRSGPN